MLNRFFRPCFLRLDPCSPVLSPPAVFGFGELFAEDFLLLASVPPGLMSKEDVYPPTKIMLCCLGMRFFGTFRADSPRFSFVKELKCNADF